MTSGSPSSSTASPSTATLQVLWSGPVLWVSSITRPLYSKSKEAPGSELIA